MKRKQPDKKKTASLRCSKVPGKCFEVLLGSILDTRCGGCFATTSCHCFRRVARVLTPFTLFPLPYSPLSLLSTLSLFICTRALSLSLTHTLAHTNTHKMKSDASTRRMATRQVKPGCGVCQLANCRRMATRQLPTRPLSPNT